MVMIQALIGPATKLLGKFIEDKDQKNKLAHDLATLASRHAQELAKGQIAANTEQAKHPSTHTVFYYADCRMGNSDMDARYNFA